MRVKICGITNLEDALQAISSGTDALGFVFYPQSPRYISPEDARKIIDQLPPFVEKVGLYVNVDASYINKTAVLSHTTLSQIHFEVDSAFLKKLDHPYIQVVRAQSKDDILKNYDHYCLIDAYCEAYGGSGKRLNLEWFDTIDCSKIILAGGLDPDNLNALQAYNFYAVDVSSGVELRKGKKDPKKVTAFIHNAKKLS